MENQRLFLIMILTIILMFFLQDVNTCFITNCPRPLAGKRSNGFNNIQREVFIL